MTVTRSALVAAMWLVPVVAFAGPRDDLLRLVPDDYTFCVIVQDLRGQAKVDGQSSYLKGLADSPLMKQFQDAPEAKKVQTVVNTILKELGVTPEDLRDDVLGDAVVFAYRKGPLGQPDKEDGLILVHARDEKLLSRLVDRINELQTQGGELKGVERADGPDGQYFRRVKAGDNARPDFYALSGHRLVFSGSEDLLKGMLARLARPGKEEPALVQRMKRLGVDSSPVVCLVNPRAFDAEVAESMKSGKASEQRFLGEFATYWKAVDGLAVSLNFRPSVEIGLSLNVRKQDLPPAAAKFFTEAGRRSPLWDRIPDDALFAFVGRFQVESLAAMFGAFLTEPDRAKVVAAIGDATRPFLESDEFGPIARGLGPDVGFWVTRPDSADRTWCPQGMVAVKVADSQDGRQAEQAALKGLDFLARLACLSNKELRIRTEKQSDLEVRYLTNTSAFPPGFRPAFASKGGYLLVASSPQSIARFNPPMGPPADATEVPILRISVAGWRAYLKDHRQGLVEYLGTINKIDPQMLKSQIDSLLPLFDGLDRIEVAQRSGPERVTVLLRFKESPSSSSAVTSPSKMPAQSPE